MGASQARRNAFCMRIAMRMQLARSQRRRAKTPTRSAHSGPCWRRGCCSRATRQCDWVAVSAGSAARYRRRFAFQSRPGAPDYAPRPINLSLGKATASVFARHPRAIACGTPEPSNYVSRGSLPRNGPSTHARSPCAHQDRLRLSNVCPRPRPQGWCNFVANRDST